jgi:hypothetical protein
MKPTEGAVDRSAAIRWLITIVAFVMAVLGLGMSIERALSRPFPDRIEVMIRNSCSPDAPSTSAPPEETEL